jgi:hypothetical protein
MLLEASFSFTQKSMTHSKMAEESRERGFSIDSSFFHCDQISHKGGFILLHFSRAVDSNASIISVAVYCLLYSTVPFYCDDDDE